MDDVGLDLQQQFFDLVICRNVVNRIYLSAKIVEYDKIEFLVTSTIIEVAFGAEGGACDEGDIVAAFGEELAGNEGIFLCPT